MMCHIFIETCKPFGLHPSLNNLILNNKVTCEWNCAKFEQII